MASQPSVNIAQRVLTGAQDFLPTGVRSLLWQLVPGLFPILDASQAQRRLFWFDYEHDMVGALQFTATFDPTPQNITRRYHAMFCQAAGSPRFNAQIILHPGAVVPGGPYRTTIASRTAGNREENMFSNNGAAGDFGSQSGFFDFPPGSQLQLLSVMNLGIGDTVNFGFIYEEMAAPAISDQQEIPVTVTEI